MLPRYRLNFTALRWIWHPISRLRILTVRRLTAWWIKAEWSRLNSNYCRAFTYKVCLNMLAPAVFIHDTPMHCRWISPSLVKVMPWRMHPDFTLIHTDSLETNLVETLISILAFPSRKHSLSCNDYNFLINSKVNDTRVARGWFLIWIACVNNGAEHPEWKQMALPGNMI